jgi:hypothetical protein
MRTTIRMSDELARRAKEFARGSGRSFTQVVEEAVSQLLDKRPRRSRRKRIILPVAGDPSHRMTEDQYRPAIEEMDLEYDLKKLGLRGHGADRR